MSIPIPHGSGRPALLRVLNDRAALALLLDEGPLTRNAIARRTGLSKPTAAEIIRRLETAGLIRESGVEESGRRGPSAVTYAPVVDTRLAVAIDVQFANVLSTVVDALGRAYPIASHRMTEAESAGDASALLIAAIDRAAGSAGVAVDDVTAIAVGVQASVDHGADRLAFTDELPGWPREAVTGTLAERLGLRVAVENDANLAALAERRAGAGLQATSFALVWLAEGLGIALDLDGRVHPGASGSAGETGYLAVPFDARELEPEAVMVADLISEAAVSRLAERHGLPSEWPGVLDAIGALPDGHPLIDELGERVGHNVLPVLAVADPETVVLHGPIGIAGGPHLARATTRWLRRATRWSTEVVAPGVVDAPVLRGAAQQLVDTLREAMSDEIRELDDAHAPASSDPTRA